MIPIELDPSLLKDLSSKSAIITGSAHGIGAGVARLFNTHGANVVVADMEVYRGAAESLIASMPQPDHAIFLPANITDWSQMKSLFKETVKRFGGVHVVVANAGTIESVPTLDMENVDENGDLLESTDAFKVIDVNLKGTLNTLRLACHFMKNNPPCFSDSSRGSVILISSMMGYFGGSGVVAYVSSKHGIIGLLRSSQNTASAVGVRVNGVAPFFTMTHITSRYQNEWNGRGMESNTPERVADVVAHVALDPNRRGTCCMVAGKYLREMEGARSALIPAWVGDDVAELLKASNQLFSDLGGYPLPKPRQ